MDVAPRQALVVLLAVLALGVATSAGVVELTSSLDYNPHTEFQEVDEDGTVIWPYTSRGTRFESRTLPLNLVVYGPPDAVERHLRKRGETDWEDDPPPGENESAAYGEAVDPDGTTVTWKTAGGATRYVYVVDSKGEGTWISEAYQLHDGDYLGSRDHIRAYVPPGENPNWTAFQAHQEHWDWFFARHVVDSVDGGQAAVESEFLDASSVESARRVYFDNPGADHDGWVTVVSYRNESGPPVASLALFLTVLPAAVVGRRYWERLATDGAVEGARTVLLAAGLVAVYLGVRLAAVELERAFPGVDPKLLAAGLYPVLAVGLPCVAYLAARQLDGHAAFGGAAIGFACALLADYTYLGVTTLPMGVVVHRVGLAVALGYVARGAAADSRASPGGDAVRTGVLLWLVGISLPLVRLL